MAQMGPKGGAQPWLSVQMLFFGALLVMMTRYTESAHTRLREAILVLWVVTAVVALLKEYRTYNLGDRIVVVGMVVILVLSVIAPLLGRGHIRALSVMSIFAAVLMLWKTLTNVVERHRAVEPFAGP